MATVSPVQYSLSRKPKEKAWAVHSHPDSHPPSPRLLPRPLWPRYLAQSRSRGPPHRGLSQGPLPVGSELCTKSETAGYLERLALLGIGPFLQGTNSLGRWIGGRGSPGSRSEPLSGRTVGALSMCRLP